MKKRERGDLSLSLSLSLSRVLSISSHPGCQDATINGTLVMVLADVMMLVVIGHYDFRYGIGQCVS